MKNFQPRALFLTITDHTTAVCLVLLSMAGALKVVFGLGYEIYYVAVGALTVVGLLRCVFALRSLQWQVTPFSRLLAALGLEKRVVLYLLLYWGLFFWLLLTVLWTTAPTAMWKEDAFYICVLVSVILLTGLCAAQKTSETFLFYWVAGAVLVCLYVLGGTLCASTPKEYMSVLKGNEGSFRLTLATPQGAALTISFFFFIVSTTRTKKLVWGLLSFLFMVGVGRTIARGTLLFGIVAISVVFCLYVWHYRGSFRDRIAQLWKYGAALASLIAGLFLIALNVKSFASHLARLTDISYEWSKYRGGRLWEPAWQHIKEAFIVGHGLGFNSVYPPMPRLHYPHNLFLQVWLDGGIVAVVALGVLLLWPVILFVKRLKANHNDPVFLSLFAVFILLVLEFSKSYDFYAGISLIVVSILSMKHLEQKTGVWM